MIVITKELNSKLIDTVIDPINEGIFHSIEETGELEWLTQELAINLDTEYYFNHSGEKWLSPLYAKLKKKQEEGRLIYALNTLAQICVRKYGDKWNRLHKVMLELEYNPIDNYSVDEKETVESKINYESNVDSDTYAFNDVNPSPTGQSKVIQSTQGSADDNIRTVQRHGNIGVTTTQQMIESELRLRTKNFYDSLMADVDELLCLSIY